MNLGDHDLLSAREQLFHERVRECIICILLFGSLYILCYFILTYFKRHTDFTTGCGCAPSLWLCPWGQYFCCHSPSSAMNSLQCFPCGHGGGDSGILSSSSPTSPSSSSCPSPTSSRSQKALPDQRRYQLSLFILFYFIYTLTFTHTYAHT
uniref:Limb development membrane protein 1 like n=1 Tax=Naja naja TaxID=35670 RepID=A0A8C6X1M6_NAJNA